MKTQHENDESEDVMSPAETLPLTTRCKHYTCPQEMPPSLSKYWHQRLDLFSLYHKNIYLTDEAWYGVTAEPIAAEMAAELHRKGLARAHGCGDEPPRVIVDLFAGAGGNTIAFARAGHWDLVVGIELDAATLACAQHNAAVYGVADRIVWVHGDCTDFLRRLRDRPWALAPELRFGSRGRRRGRPRSEGRQVETGLVPLARGVELFASPPWGGPQYSGAEVFNLNAMQPYGVEALHREMWPMAHALFLPRNGDLEQLADLVNGSGEKLDVVQYCINGASKGLVAYYPADEAYVRP